MIVNWVKEDEELLEPYEWQEGDDIEIISTMPLFHVDKQTLYDFIYGCLYVFDQELYEKIFIVGDSDYVVAVETNKEGKLCFRSVLDYSSRHYLQKQLLNLPQTCINYQKYDEAYPKIYGMTRSEREKKQYIEEKMDDLYINHPSKFHELCALVNISGNSDEHMYQNLLELIDTSYNENHELIYLKLKK